MRYSEESCLILARAWRPRSKSIRGEGTARSARTRIATPEQARPIAPQQAHPARWSHRAGPPRTPHRAHLAYSTALKLPLGPRNKIGPDCNFFAISNCSKLSNRESRHKNAGNWPYCGLLPPSGDEKRAPNREKVAKCRDFCFCDGRNRRNGSNCRNGLNATGQTYRSNSTETGQWSDPMISE